MTNNISLRDMHISRGVYEGKFIFVRQIQRDIFVVCVPDDNEYKTERAIYVLVLNESMYITEFTEIKLPLFDSINISKIYQDTRSNAGDFMITGSLVKELPDGSLSKVRHDFRIKNYSNIELFESKKTVAGVVFDFALDDVQVESISKKGDLVHTVGYRKKTNDDVYIQYNSVTKKVNKELAFYSDEGVVILKDVHCNNDNEVIVVGYVETDTCNVAYLNKFMVTAVGSVPV